MNGMVQKKKKTTTSTDAKTIAETLTYLFTEGCPKLADLDPCMKISSTIPPGCYFQEIAGINLSIEDEQIPLPI